MGKLGSGCIETEMSPSIRLSLKQLLLAILSGIWIIIIFANLFYWFEAYIQL
jgi:hypothetical protein